MVLGKQIPPLRKLQSAIFAVSLLSQGSKGSASWTAGCAISNSDIIHAAASQEAADLPVQRSCCSISPLFTRCALLHR